VQVVPSPEYPGTQTQRSSVVLKRPPTGQVAATSQHSAVVHAVLAQVIDPGLVFNVLPVGHG